MEEAQATCRPIKVFLLSVHAGRVFTRPFRVLDTFEAMLTGDDLTENGDTYIFDRMIEFLQQELVSTFATSRRVLVLIDRAVSHTGVPECSDC